MYASKKTRPGGRHGNKPRLDRRPPRRRWSDMRAGTGTCTGSLAVGVVAVTPSAAVSRDKRGDTGDSPGLGPPDDG